MSGFYGKLPSKGDFVSRNLPRSFVSAFDEWFQRGIQSSKEKLGDSWFSYYQVMPIWHFYIGTDVFGEAWLGTWIPSADKVNRSFPVLIADTILPLQKVSDFLVYRSWFSQSAEILIEGLEQAVEFEQFCQNVDDLAAPKNGAGEWLLDEVTECVIDAAGSEGLAKQLDVQLSRLKPYLTSESKTPGEQLSPKLLGEHLNTGSSLNKVILSSHAIFWSEGSEYIGEQLVVTERLPDAEEFTKFLRGYDARAE